MRRFISVLLALVICFSLACTVSAATSSTPNEAPKVDLGNIGSTTQGSNASMTVVIKGANKGNTTVRIKGGSALSSSDYSVSDKGALTLNPSYLKDLPAGTYEMEVQVGNQTYTLKFTVNARGVLSFFDNPKTGDMARMELWVPMMAVSALALVAVLFFYFKKVRKVN